MSQPARLRYIDWMRGFAVLLMMETHAYDSWLTPAAKAEPFHRWSRLAGGYPAPLFLFLAGLSLALLAEARFARGLPGGTVAREGARRGLQVLGYAGLFRLWLFLTSGLAQPSDLLRVDVLNCIGLSMLLVAMLALRWDGLRRRLGAAVGLAGFLACLTPYGWDSRWPASIPNWLLGYVDGRIPGAFFPLLPWAGFTALGAAVGICVARARSRGRETAAVTWLTLLGAACFPAGLLLDRLPTLAPRYDYWHTSPSYFLIKSGVVVLVLSFSFLWDRMPWSGWPSALRQLGRASLFVYWVHIELVYGLLFEHTLKHRLSLAGATLGLCLLTLAMLAVSLARTEGPRWWKRRRPALGQPAHADAPTVS